MARRRAKGLASVSASPLQLLPFLSVVACTLGTIILLIIIIATKVATDAQQTLLALPENQNSNVEPTDKQAVYVECQEEGVIIYPGNQFVSMNEIDDPNSAFQQLLSQVKTQENYIVYFLVRPSGVSVFDKTRAITEAEEINFRYEPIDENWQLDT